MRRRGLTILELLVAMAVMVSLTALVVPSVMGRLGEFSLDAGARQFEAALIAARARSQREGVPLALVARRDADGLTGLYIEPLASPEESEESVGAKPDAWVVLPERVGITDAPPVDGVEGDVGRAGRRFEGADASSADSGAAMVVAAVLPDGSTTLTGPRFLIRVGGDGLRIRVNRWTGGATFERVDGSVEVPATEEGADEEDVGALSIEDEEFIPDGRED